MTFGLIIKTLFEFAAVGFVVWCIFHEDRLVAFEEKLLANFRRKRLQVVKSNNVQKYIA